MNADMTDSALLPLFPRIATLILALLVLSPLAVEARGPSLEEISRAIEQKDNRALINAFMKYELGEVNEYATKPLMSKYPSLIFFINQAERDPLGSLLFLETWVGRLREAQKNIDSIAYSIAFSSSEKEKIMSLVPTTKKIISYGIPLMKRDIYSALMAIRYLAGKKNQDPLQLLKSPDFRDAVYRQCESDPKKLDKEMGELSEGELICMRLGWVLEEIRLTRLWIVLNDNELPKPKAYMAYREKRSAYWQKRLKRIFPDKKVSSSPSEALGSPSG